MGERSHSVTHVAPRHTRRRLAVLEAARDVCVGQYSVGTTRG